MRLPDVTGLGPLFLAQAAGSGFGYLPFLLLGAYLAVLIAAGFYGYLKSKKTEEDYYLAGRRQGLLISTS